MITEQYVSFETSKMLKEAGFDVPTRGTWRTNCTGDTVFVEHFYGQTTDDISRHSADGFQHEYLAPTQSLAARWLWEVHRIFIEDYILINGAFSYRIFIGGRNQLECEQHNIYKSYEDCVEYALQEAIKLIKK